METTTPVGYTTYSFTIRLSPAEAESIRQDMISDMPAGKMSGPTFELYETISAIASKEPKE